MPDPALVRFHHFGLAARDPARAAAFLRVLGYEVGPLVRDPLQGVDLAMATHPSMPAVEIIAPLGDAGPLAAALRRDAEVVYHVCFETDDRARALAAMREAGGRVIPISEATPATLFGGRAVSFHRVAGFGLIELLDAAEAA
jgi:methylmalonyl-CoA/ethylmalonyl-CoA epimerase